MTAVPARAGISAATAAVPRPPVPRFSVRYVRDRRLWAVFDGNARTSGWYSNQGAAGNAAAQQERNARRLRRLCMTCAGPFMSDGIGHRMCDRCRHAT